ncbi:hypothetical protein [Caulobacter sp. 602-1]|uniref:hypothetical protein n=1 Tax=Caulobacter sp. 602-1 TaxID=2492472 RepID=UPI000F62DFC3|nr:hypothetical protein [Caulobacter sp. 602-1]RRN64104.1 hypothetical protein EIK80_15225 [Caulobacter sp. 602-1]
MRNKTWRAAILATAALAALAACGRAQPKDPDASTRVEVNGGEVTVGQLQKDSARAETAAVKGTKPLAPASLPALLPATVGGFARTDVRSQAGTEPGMTKVSARYVKDGAAFTLEVVDLGAIGSVGASDSAVGAHSTRRTATGYETVTTAGGRTVTEQWDDTAKSGRYAVVAADRYSIAADGAADSAAVLKAAVETVNAARLRALAVP